ERGQGRRVMAARTREDPFARLTEDERAADAVLVQEHVARPVRATNHASLQAAVGERFRALDRYLIEDRRVHELVDEPHLQRFACADVSPGENHVQSGLEANEARQALGSTASGNEPELYFREAEHRFRRVGAYAVRARQRSLEPTAEARAVDRRDDGGFQLL